MSCIFELWPVYNITTLVHDKILLVKRIQSHESILIQKAQIIILKNLGGDGEGEDTIVYIAVYTAVYKT